MKRGAVERSVVVDPALNAWVRPLGQVNQGLTDVPRHVPRPHLVSNRRCRLGTYGRAEVLKEPTRFGPGSPHTELVPAPPRYSAPPTFPRLGVSLSRSRWPEATFSAVSGSQLPTFHVGARIGLTPPIRRMPPEQRAGLPRADHEPYVRLAFDIVQRSSRRVASGSLLRSSFRSIPDDLEDRLFRDVHHPGRCAGAARGGLQPPPARAAAEGLPPSPTQHGFGAPYLHRFTSAFVAQTQSEPGGRDRRTSAHHRGTWATLLERSL